jgi:serine/threonine-protein kinase
MLCPDLPAWVDAVVLRCLKKSPDERFQTVVELAEVLQPHVAPGPSRFSGASRRHSAPISRLTDGGATARATGTPLPATSTGSTWDRTAPQPSRARSLPALFATIAAGGIAAAIGGAVWLLKAPPPGEPGAPGPGATEVIASGTSIPTASIAASVELAPAEPKTTSPPASAAPTSLPAATTKGAKPLGKPAATANATSAPKAGVPKKHEGIY